MRLLLSLLRPIRVDLSIAVLSGALSGMASMGLVALINRALAVDSSALASIGGQFAIASVVALFFRWLSEERFARLGQRVLARLRIDLSNTIAALPYATLEQRGVAHFNGVLTEDTNAVAHSCSILPGVVINTFLVLGGLVYMLALSERVFALVLLVLIAGVFAYALVESRALASLRSARRAEDDVFSCFVGLLSGAKELKLHAPRRRAFLREGLAKAVERVRALRSRGQSISIAASSVGASMFFLVIGVVAFWIGPSWGLERAVVSGYALVFLFLMYPLESLLGSLPTLERGRIALEHLAGVAAPLDAATGEPPRGLDDGKHEVAQRFSSLRFEGVTHRYRRENEPGEFVLGPIDLELSPSQVTFLVGGNGSGKTTLAKLLVGLYAPEHGRIWLDGVELTDATRESHRERCSAVFSDFHLFESLWGLDAANVPNETRAWLDRLQLSTRVRLEGSRFSTTLLSHGQRKRLAFLVACLEERPILLFDEWAADQDPNNKGFFYCELLPALRRLGKAVVVVTHDDRYFDVADRCLELEFGRLVKKAPPSGTLSELRPQSVPKHANASASGQ